MADVSSSNSRPQRRPKDRDAEPDLYDKMIALQRKQHSVPLRTRDRPERPSTRSTSPVQLSPPRRANPPPQVVVSRTDSVEPAEDYPRRKKPSVVSPRSHHMSAHSSKLQGKLYNPDVDPTPTMKRTAEPDIISDTGSSSYAPRNTLSSQDRGAHHGRLFDHKRDDPVRFHVLARPNPANGNRPTPTPKSSGDYVSASSTSSYAHSITSSNFTLNSTTDGSSASSAVFDQQNREHTSSGAFAAQLKKLYRSISNLESNLLLKDEGKDTTDEVRISLKRPNESTESNESEKEKWKKFVADHKSLAESMHNLLRLTLAPHVPASLRNIPTKYNIIIRLWTHAFNKPLEALRRSSFQSPVALEHLQDFIIYAYTFYTMLLEEPTLESFKAGWLEALGDLARYRMAIAAMTAPQNHLTGGDFTPVNQTALAAQTQPETTIARIDDSPGPSVGVAAARALELEPEKERWRCIARQWYACGLADTPGTGKLHHHLGLLSRDADGEELRAVYHFVKSMTTLHPFPTSRESILPIWSLQAQARRSTPDAHTSELFVLLHGMIFTNIQLDDFLPMLARFMERLRLEEPEERDWIMMAIVNITSVLEYGRPTGVLRSIGGIGNATGQVGKEGSTAAAAAASAKVNMMVKKLDEMEVDDTQTGSASASRIQGIEQDAEVGIEGKVGGVINVSPVLIQSSPVPIEDIEPPLAFKYALQLTFDMLSYALRNPKRSATPFLRETLNPYITIILTFLVTVLKQPTAQKALERAIPWADLASFFCTIPRGILGQAEGGIRLTSACPPLPEDWCMRGMEWVGRRVYERGFWKTGEDRQPEMEVLNKSESSEHLTDGIIEDESEDSNAPASRSDYSETKWRWVRIVRAAAGLAKVVPGFNWDMGSRDWEVTGELREKVLRWEEEDRLLREEEERRRSRRPWVDDGMDIDDESDQFVDPYSEESEDDEQSEEVKMLRARRDELMRLMQTSQRSQTGAASSRPRGSRRRSSTLKPNASLHVIPGYTVLVIDTNILLSSLSIFSSLVESLRWTIVVPLAVITELDGIASNSSQLGEVAKSAIKYIVSHLRSHSMSLKVQTSKGNYMSTLTVRSEQLEFASDSWERNMDDLILRAAIWQDDHWVDRSGILGESARDTNGAAKVVLMSFDRNLRLKARARQLDAADEKDMATILKAGS